MEGLKVFALIIIALIHVVQGSTTMSPTTSGDNMIFCNPDWYYYDGKCYKLGTNESEILEVSWHAAADKCKEYGGYLITISSSNLQEFFVSHFLLETKENIWIGLHKPSGQSRFVWHDGSPFVYKNWGWLQPSLTWDGQAEDCTEIMYHASPKGKWNDRACDVERAFVCQMDMDPTVNSQNPEYCPEDIGGGRRFRDVCFHFVDSRKNWQDAEDYCVQQYSGHLATVEDAATLLFLEDFYKNVSDVYWVGLHLQAGGLQKWTSGRYLDLYEAEKFQAVLFAIIPYCGIILRQKILDVDQCKVRYPFLCETYVTKPKSPTLSPALTGSRCPRSADRWIDLGGEYCYIFSSETADWDQANYNCRIRGGALASFHSKEELEVIEPFYSLVSPDVHIGLARDGQSDSFNWVDGSEVEFLAWNSDQPDNKMERCTEMTTSTMGWNDINCGVENRYICSIYKTRYIPQQAVTQENTPFTTVLPTRLTKPKKFKSQPTENAPFTTVIPTSLTDTKKFKSPPTDLAVATNPPEQTEIFHIFTTESSTATYHKGKKTDLAGSPASSTLVRENQSKNKTYGQTNVLNIIGIVVTVLVVLFIVGGVLFYFKPWSRMKNSIPYSPQMSLLEKEDR